MTENSEFSARLLKAGARAYAAYASDELLASHPEAKESCGPEPFSAWQGWLAARVEELSAAVSANQPDLFISQVRWARSALAARGVSERHFRAGLTHLKDVLAKELPESARAPVTQCLEKALDEFDVGPAEILTSLLPDTEHGRLAAAYLLALLEGDRRRASRLVLDAVDPAGDVRKLYLEVLLPAQKEVGRMWLAGEISVAEEHFASNTTRTVMAQLLSLAAFEPPNGKTALTAAVAGNHHDIGLHAVADFFEMAGWRTIQLGANVPTDDLLQSVECFSVDLLALAATLNVQVETIRSTIQAIRNGPRGDVVKVLVGGLAFAGSQSLARDVGADGYAADPNEAVRLGGQLVGLPPGLEVD
jgi:methanogenic corrinoid protein MtbC1